MSTFQQIKQQNSEEVQTDGIRTSYLKTESTSYHSFKKNQIWHARGAGIIDHIQYHIPMEMIIHFFKYFIITFDGLRFTLPSHAKIQDKKSVGKKDKRLAFSPVLCSPEPTHYKKVGITSALVDHSICGFRVGRGESILGARPWLFSHSKYVTCTARLRYRTWAGLLTRPEMGASSQNTPVADSRGVGCVCVWCVFSGRGHWSAPHPILRPTVPIFLSSWFNEFCF